MVAPLSPSVAPLAGPVSTVPNIRLIFRVYPLERWEGIKLENQPIRRPSRRRLSRWGRQENMAQPEQERLPLIASAEHMVARETPQILIVEDDEAMREFLCQAISRSGYYVEAVPDGAEALRRVEESHFDLLLTDIRMPGLDGLELARQARRRYPGLNVLLVTAYVQDALGATDLEGAGIEVLSKPFNLNELIDRVETFLPQ
jgi:CheY-like chemotaxis protein